MKDLENAVAPAIEGILRANSALFSHFDPGDCIAAFDQVPDSFAYHHVPKAVDDLWRRIEAEFGASGFDAFQRLTMLTLIRDFESRSHDRKYTDGVLARFGISFRRIITSARDPEFALYRDQNDILLKDLALCRQAMFPVGHRIVEPNSGFSRSLAFRGGVSQAVRFLWLLATKGGHTRWYQVHTHLSELEEFNAEGWAQACLLLADMMKLHPEIRGVVTGSWFNDPLIEMVSPRLTYLRKMPQDNGAHLFFTKVSTKGGALSKSKTRQELHRQGKYLPRIYTLAWPRKAMLTWADAKRGAN